MRAHSRIPRGLVAALTAVAALGAVLVGPAGATSNTVIGFDDLSSGTVVSNQYASQGLQLGSATSFGQTSPGRGDCGSPTVGSGAVPAASSPNYAVLATCNASPVGTVPAYYSGTFGALLSYARASVSVEVRLTGGSGAAVPMALTAYSSSGAVVASGSGSAVGSSWTMLTAAQASGAQPQISYFQITTTTAASDPAAAPTVAIDNVSFDHAGAPLSATGTTITATAGSPFSGAVATITDGDPTATPSDFTATIQWGDGATTFGTVSAAGGGQFTVSGSHTWSAAGTYTVHVAIDKINGRTAATNSTANVSAAGGGGGSSPRAVGSVLTAHPTAGELITLSGAGSTPGSGRIIAYDWGFDNPHTTTSTGTNPTAHFIFRPGQHTVTLTVTNSGGQKSTTHFGVSVGTNTNAILPDGGQGDCKPTYDNGSVHIIADCIQTLSGGGYVISTHRLALNGMVLAPKAGIGVFKILPFNHLGIGSGTQLSGPVVNVELLNTPIGDMVLGGQDLSTTPINLTFKAFQPPHIVLAPFRPGFRARAADDEGKTLLMSLGVGKLCSSGVKDPTCCPPSNGTTACATLPGGFPLTGQLNVYLNNKGQSLFDVQVGLDLSAVNFEATGTLEVVADPQNGINLNSLQFAIPEAGLANIFQVKDASFVYYFPSDPDASKRDTWQAKGKIIFGPLSQPSLAGELDFQKGQFHKASMVFTAPSGTGVPIYPGILLNQIGATVGVNPLEFGGQLGASIATQLELSLAFLYSEPTDTQLGFFGGQGQLTFQDDKIATLAADVYSDGYTDAALDIDLHFPFSSDDPIVKVTGHIGFWDEPSSGRWEADGSVALKLWVISAEVAGLVNDQYVAGCADISGFGVQGRYKFADSSVGGGLFGFSNCNDQLKQYKETPVTPHSGGFVGSLAGAPQVSAAATGGGGTVRLPGGTLGQELLIGTSGGTPQVTIYGPGHLLITTPSRTGQVVSGPDYISAIAPDGHHVIVLLRHPRGGLYNLQPAGSSGPIRTVAAAQDVPPARLRVRVAHSRGRHWKLSYRIRNYVAGTRVQFVERGRDSTHVLATVRRARGSFHFVPEDAIARRRTIFAYLQTRSGAPLRTMVAGHYRAPRAIRPAKVRKLRIARHGSSAILTFGRAANARQYLVLMRGSDGRVRSFFVGRRRRVALSQVLPYQRLTAKVTPEGGPNMLSGPSSRTTLAPAAARTTQELSCSRGRCSGALVSGSVVVKAGEVHARLYRGSRVRATGIASGLRGSVRLALSAARPLPHGRYRLVLSYRRRHVRRAIVIR